MGYNLNKLRKELTENNLADDGLVAWGQNTGMGGIAASMMNPMFTISKTDKRILIIPFSNKAINYGETLSFDKGSIDSAKIKGVWLFSKLVIKTRGVTYKYSITQGKKAVKQILMDLGF